MEIAIRSINKLLGALVLSLLAGCTLGPYHYGTKQTSLLPLDSALSPPILVGGPVRAMDQFEQAVNAPRDAMSNWGKKLSQRNVGPKATAPESTQQDALLAAVAYLEDNDLHHVIVEAHHHDPLEQWKRLEANPDVHPLWKYTDGAARISAYTLFPPRVYRFDSYNPYTKTLSINSKNPAAAIYEAAKAKNHSLVAWPGAYAAMRYVPLAPVGQQIAVSQDAMAYVQQNADPSIERAMVSHTLSNLTGSALLSSSALTPQLNEIPLISAPASQAIGAATGNIASRWISPRRSESTYRPSAKFAASGNPFGEDSPQYDRPQYDRPHYDRPSDGAPGDNPPSYQRLSRNLQAPTYR